MPLDPASLLDPSHLLTFLAGAATGAAGKYMADRFTDQRRRSEAETAERQRFSRVRHMMPELLREMAQDLIGNASVAAREFVVLRDESYPYTNDRVFRYYESVHPHARNQVAVLVSEGYVEKRDGVVPVFRFKEDFVSRLLMYTTLGT